MARYGLGLVSISSQLAGPLEITLGNRKDAVAVKKVVKQVLVDTLACISSHQLENAATTGRASGNGTAKFEGSRKLGSLPTEGLKADEAIKSSLVEMSLSQLYRATRQGRFYCARPRVEARDQLHPAQSAMLSLSMPERLALVKELFEAPLSETAIG